MLVGLDIGGTAIKAVALSGIGEPLSLRSIAIGAKASTPDPATRLEVVRVCAGLLSEIHIETSARVGVAVAGIVDSARGEVLRSVNLLALEGERFAVELAQATGAKVRLVADVAAAAVAEFRALDGPRPDAWAHLRIGTGVGLAVVRDGEIEPRDVAVRTHRAELIVPGAAHACPCGLTGCLENVASGRVLDGVSASPAAIDRAVFATRSVLAALPARIGVRDICIGGGVLAHIDRFRAGVLEEPIDGTRTTPARLGDEAGAIGAALLAATPP